MKKVNTYTRKKRPRRHTSHTMKHRGAYCPEKTGGDAASSGPAANSPEDLSNAADFLNGMVDGIMSDIKNAIAQKAASIFRGNVTSRFDNYFFSKLPNMFRRRIMGAIDLASYKIVNDAVQKAASVAENMVKAVPATGNIVSLVIAGDKAYAMAKNLLDGVNMVRDEILSMKQELLEVGLDPDVYLPIYVPPVPQLPEISLPGLTSGDDPFGDQIQEIMMQEKMAKKNRGSAAASKKIKKMQGGESVPVYVKCIQRPDASSGVCRDILQRTSHSIETFRGGGHQNKNTPLQCTQRPGGAAVCRDILQRTNASIQEFRGG